MYENQHQQQGSSLANSARSKFVRKVYTLMTLQLATTVAVVYANMILPYFAYLQATSSWLFFMASVGSIVTLAMLYFSKQCQNYYVMAGFTLCESYLVACICSMYTPMSVLLSTVATLMATLGLTFYAVTTKTDFTAIFSYVKAWLSSLIWMVLGVTMINLFFLRSPAVQMFLGIIIGTFYSGYLLVDTHLILGGRHHELSLDNHILGATILYVDIIQLFLEILRIVGKKKEE